MRGFLLRLVLTCAALWLAFRHVAWQDVAQAWHTPQPVYVIIALTAIMAQTLCGGLRWQVIRRVFGSHDSSLHTTLIYYASSFFNICLPGTIGGDVSRVWLAKHTGGRMRDIIYSILIDRIWSLAGLMLLVVSTFGVLFPTLGLSATLGLILSALCWLAGLAKIFVLRWLLPRIPTTRFAWFNDLIAALLKMLAHFGPLAASLLLALMAHLCYATAAWALAQSLGLELSWFVCIALIPLVLFAATLPISLGGWGVREVSMSGVLALAGIANPQALALSLMLGLASTVVGLGGGVYYLLYRRG